MVSDWSSDVCSSDLRQKTGRRRERARQRRSQSTDGWTIERVLARLAANAVGAEETTHE